MAGDDFIQRAPEHELIERSMPAHRQRHVERRMAARLQLIEQPKAPLPGSGRKSEHALISLRDLIVPVHLIVKYLTTGVSGESRDRLERAESMTGHSLC